MTRRPSGAPARRDAVEQRVFDAVERLLDEGRPFTELSVGAIAEAAGIARSTFYVHFADKTVLLVRLAESAMADITVEGERWLTSDHAGGPDQLAPSMRRVIATYRRHQRLFEAVLAGTGYDPAVAAFWRDHIEQTVAAGTARLGQLQAEGRLRRDIDIEPLARMMAWSIERTVSMHVAQRPVADDEALARGMARALWLMLYGDAPS